MEMGDLMNASLKALLNEQYKLVANLREENKKLKEELDRMTERACDYKGEITELKMENEKLKEENKQLKEIKELNEGDLRFY